MERTRIKTFGPKTSSAFLGAFVVSQGFHVGSWEIRFYSLTMLTAIIVGYFLSLRQAKQQGIDQSSFDDISFWLVLISFLCARIYYVLFYPQYYKADFADVFKIWHGGLAIYGALIGGLITLLILARRKKIPFFKLSDIIVFGLPLAQAIGRFGNYFNYEAFGRPTNLPWRMFVPVQFRPSGYESFSYFTPTFLYEAIWNVIIFFALYFVLKRRKANAPVRYGFLTGVYLLLYSVGRFFIEGIRLDSAYFHGFRGDQLTALILILGAVVLIFYTFHEPQKS